MSPDTIARWQFGITTVYHFLFVPLTIALSVLTAVLQTIWNKTGNDAYLRLTKFFGRLFLINFAMGVVTGIVQEFQFGMNWSEYSRFVGDIFGAPLALEALIAFFLESTFLGMWIFGWDRLSKKAHLVTIWLGAIGTFISSIFIVAANAWMQNPTGASYNPATQRAELDSLLQVILNPAFLTQWPHTIAASFVTAGGFMAGAAFYLLVKNSKEKAPKGDLTAYRKGLKMGAWVLVIAGVFTIVTGDFLGKQLVTHQPMKMAAAENLKEPLADSAKVGFQIVPKAEVFPGLLNWLYGTKNIQTIDDVKANQIGPNGYRFFDRKAGEWVEGSSLQTTSYSAIQGSLAEANMVPSVGVSFWSFRLMMGIGFLAMLGGIVMLVVTRGGKVPNPGWFWTCLAICMPVLPLLANSFGWIFTEMGRQPWIVNGVMPTLQGLSPTVGTGPVWLSLVLYTAIYGLLAVVEVGLLLKYIKMGLPAAEKVSIKDEGEELSFAY
ncbi:MAG: cytochrome ubiquinol oxidase subunit I [Propionibacteriaceae bacterium]|nr:cytochrome ubiquinol oxidase subunit I [Propionibacteriaceae bacterium]